MNRIQFSCSKCQSGYTVPMESRYAKTCRVCEGIAKEAGLELESPNVQSAIDAAVAKAVERAEKRAKERYDAELAKDRATSKAKADAKPVDVKPD